MRIPFLGAGYTGVIVQTLTYHYAVLRETQSDTVVLNDSFMQLGVYEMPFGGIGDSGCKCQIDFSKVHR